MASKTLPAGSSLFSATRAEEQKLRKIKQSLSQQYLQPSTQAKASAAVTTAFNLRSATSPAPETNVVGLGLGEKISQGRSTGIPAVKVLVRIKYPESQIPKGFLLPKSVQGMPVDVEEVGTFRAAHKQPLKPQAKITDPRVRLRPAHPGSSVGFRDPSNAFTMAGRTRDACMPEIPSSSRVFWTMAIRPQTRSLPCQSLSPSSPGQRTSWM